MNAELLRFKNGHNSESAPTLDRDITPLKKGLVQLKANHLQRLIRVSCRDSETSLSGQRRLWAFTY